MITMKKIRNYTFTQKAIRVMILAILMTIAVDYFFNFPYSVSVRVGGHMEPAMSPAAMLLMLELALLGTLAAARSSENS